MVEKKMFVPFIVGNLSALSGMLILNLLGYLTNKVIITVGYILFVIIGIRFFRFMDKLTVKRVSENDN